MERLTSAERGRSATAAHEHVRRALAGDRLRALVAERAQVEPGEEVLPRAHQHRAQHEVHLVDEARLEVLPHGGHAAADADVAPARGLARLLQRLVDAAGDEAELGAPL